MNRQNRVLAALLTVQLVVLAVVFWPGTPAAGGEQLFGDLETDQVVELTIRDAGGGQLHMAKGAQGWTLPEAGDFPVQEDNVAALVDRIVNLRTDRLVTHTRDSHARLQVTDDDFQRLIEFELQDGTRHKLYLGSSPRFQVLHVRADDRDEVYLSLGLSTSDAGVGVSAWVNTDYFSVPQDDIVALMLENRNGRFEFEKDEAGTWTMLNLPPGEKLLENNVSSLATRVSGLRLQRPLGREEEASYDLADPNAKVTLRTRDAEGNERTYIVRVGSQPEGEQGYVVKSATSPYYVLLAEFTVSDLVEKTLQDFIEAPPTPTPAPQEPEETPTPTP
jgi:hypothetical protein